jgi:zinc protease
MIGTRKSKERSMTTGGSNMISVRRIALPLGFLVFLALFRGPAVDAGDYASLAYQSERLDNGLKVIVYEDHELPVVSFALMIRAGSIRDPAGKEGLAGFTAGTLTKGTTSRSAIDIAETIDFVGGSLSASAGYDASYLSCRVLKKDYALGLELLSDILLHPTFAEGEIERERSQIVTALIGERDRKSAIADRHFDEVLFGEHPYSHPVIGTRKGVEAITREDIVEFHETYFRPNISVIVVAGDVDRTSVIASLREAFEGWQPAILPDPPHPEVPRPEGHRIRLVNKPDVTQSEIRVGYLGVSRSDPDFLAYRLMNYSLGAGSFSSRLMKTVRGEKGLTYGIFSDFAARSDRGPFTISTFTKTESTLETIRVILDEMVKMKLDGVTPSELKDAKARYIGGWPLGLETPSQIVGKIHDVELYGLGENYLARYTELLDQVSLDEVNRVASEFLRAEDLVIVVVANAEAVREDLTSLGEIEEVFFMELSPELQKQLPGGGY